MKLYQILSATAVTLLMGASGLTASAVVTPTTTMPVVFKTTESTLGTTQGPIDRSDYVVTTSLVAQSTQPVFDEEGHYRGTDALQDVYLYMTELPQMKFKGGEGFNYDGLKLMVVEQRRFNTYWHDVTGLARVETNFDMTKAGTYTVKVTVDYDIPEWGEDIDPYYYDITVEGDAPVDTAPSTKISGSDSETTETTIKTTDISIKKDFVVTTSCVSDSPVPVWDEDGHYRGTNALLDVYPMLGAKKEYAIGEQLDPADFKMYVVEERCWNVWWYDVSGCTEIVETDFNSEVPGTYKVVLSTDYMKNDWNKPVGTLEIYVDVRDIPAVTNVHVGEMTTTLPTTTTMTTVTTTTGASLVETYRGDINGDRKITVSDAITLCRICVSDIVGLTMRENVREFGDMDKDGVLSTLDVVALLRRISEGSGIVIPEPQIDENGNYMTGEAVLTTTTTTTTTVIVNGSTKEEIEKMTDQLGDFIREKQLNARIVCNDVDAVNPIYVLEYDSETSAYEEICAFAEENNLDLTKITISGKPYAQYTTNTAVTAVTTKTLTTKTVA